jgi:hypothetical protein
MCRSNPEMFAGARGRTDTLLEVMVVLDQGFKTWSKQTNDALGHVERMRWLADRQEDRREYSGSRQVRREELDALVANLRVG